MMRALVVLPQPRGPEKRYAWLTRLLSSACDSGPGDVVLPDHLGERVRPVAAVEGERGIHADDLSAGQGHRSLRVDPTWPIRP